MGSVFVKMKGALLRKGQTVKASWRKGWHNTKRLFSLKSLKRLRSPRGKIFPVFGYTLLVAWCAILLFLLFWALFASLKDDWDLILSPLGFPEKLRFDNYAQVYKNLQVPVGQRNVGFWEMLLYSLLYCIGVPFFAVMSACMTSYIACKYRQFKAVRMLYSITIFTTFVPISASLASTLRLLNELRLYDSIIGMYIFSSGAFGFMFMVYYATFKNLSWSFAEAAFIDGAGHLRVFVTIMIPLTKTVFGALFITTFIGVWTDYMVNVVYLPSYPMLAYGAFTLQWNPDISAMPTRIAGMIFLAMPVFILFMFFKKKLMGALTMGGLKG